MYRILIIFALCFFIGCVAERKSNQKKPVETKTATETSMLYFGATW